MADPNPCCGPEHCLLSAQAIGRMGGLNISNVCQNVAALAPPQAIGVLLFPLVFPVSRESCRRGVAAKKKASGIALRPSWSFHRPQAAHRRGRWPRCIIRAMASKKERPGRRRPCRRSVRVIHYPQLPTKPACAREVQNGLAPTDAAMAGDDINL